ncbi:MAG: hypothetical protein KAI24_00330 [Planctomycetes bacterium]|nr:hypothetical protein [Planctomycetota bacterium]
MSKLRLAAVVTIGCVFLPSCGTSHAVRWAYGHPSAFEAPSQHSEESGLRAAIGLPVIVGGVLFDVTTFPLQAMFGVWPWWGEHSQMMTPDDA